MCKDPLLFPMKMVNNGRSYKQTHKKQMDQKIMNKILV